MKIFPYELRKRMESNPFYFVHDFHEVYTWGLLIVCRDGFKYLDGWSEKKEDLQKILEKRTLQPAEKEQRIIRIPVLKKKEQISLFQ